MQTPSDPSYREIPLTQGKVALVSTHRFDEVSKHKWCVSWRPKNKTFYAYARFRIDGIIRTVYMHRFILGVSYGDKRTVDHENHNTLDNRDHNLRVASCAQQQYNRTKQANNTSGYKGVSWDKPRRKWQAKIAKGGRQKLLGRFNNAEEAYTCYCKAAKEMHGEFACF